MPWKDPEVRRARMRKRYAEDEEFRKKSREATDRWEAENPGKGYTPEYGRMKQLERRYKMTPQDYEKLLESQDGHCALCEATQFTHKRRLTVDHDHKHCPKEKACGKCNRGILCANCNRKIGFLELTLKDLLSYHVIPTSWTGKAIQYINKWHDINQALADPEETPNMYEDDLPADMPKKDYDEWYAESFIPGSVGVRVGPVYPTQETQ